uniref:Uncharacterized protein n=1 Tax=Ditylenchus dipsaci TaxID=166011 RepID=A0A915DA31_9BILA
MVHLNQKDLFQCSKCDYTNSNSIWELKKHCISQHGTDTVALSNEEKHKKAIQTWNQKCFPDWRQKRAPFWSKSEGEKEEIENEVSEELLDCDDQQTSLTTCLQSFIQRMSSVDQSTCNSTSAAASGMDSPASQSGEPWFANEGNLNLHMSVEDKSLSDLHSVLQAAVDQSQLTASNSSAKSVNSSRQTAASDRICHLCCDYSVSDEEFQEQLQAG